MMQINPYLHFRAETKDAMEFYQSIFGGKLDMNSFADFQATDDPDEAKKIMHAMLTTETGMVFMASDTPNSMAYEPGQSITMSLSGDEEDKLREYWNKLTKGAKITMPLEKAPWGDTFGMLTDKFGIEWMVNISAHKAA
jgi:PhnB protein